MPRLGVDFGHMADMVGARLESATDLHVALTGPAFKLTRAYTSDPNFDGADLVGEGWIASPFVFLKIGGGANPDLEAVGLLVRAQTYTHNTGVWTTGGPITQHIEASTITIGGNTYATYRLHEPGSGSIHFYQNDTTGGGGKTVTPIKHAGLIAAEMDEHGNRRNYEYTVFGSALSDPDKFPRLTRISCKNATGTEEARIDFAWQDNDALPNKGRLLSVKDFRYDGVGWIEMQRVVYTYKKNGDGLPDALGIEGDLIDVRKHVRVDDSSGSVSTWRTWATQYRYHSAGENESSTDVDADGYIENGQDHQLKMVFNPEQVEWFARRRSDTDMGVTSLATGADTLLTLEDGDFISGGIGQKVVDAAAVVFNSYETSGDGRLLQQYTLSSCGCGGFGTQGLRKDYDYFPYTVGSHSNGAVYDTMQVIESAWSVSTWVTQRTVYVDTGPITSGGVPEIINIAIVAPSGDKWVRHYEYDGTTKDLVKFVTPDAVNSYTPGSKSGSFPSFTYTAPSFSAKNNAGLVYAWEYTADHRHSSFRVGEGDLGSVSSFTKLADISYGNGSGSTRKHLPAQIKKYRVAGSASADDVEQTDFTYGFHTSGKNDLSMVLRTTEAELVAENGPGGSIEAYALINTLGQKVWDRSGDKALTKYAYQTGTGAVVAATANHSTSGLSTGDYPGLSSISGWSRNGDGGKLETAFARDLLGRVQKVTAPGGVEAYVRREMQAEATRPGIEYYAEVRLPHIINGGAAQYDGPVLVDVLSAAGKPIRSSEYALGASAITITNGLASAYTLGTELSKAVSFHDLSGVVTESRAWHDVANNGYYATTYAYDDLGRLKTTTDGLGTITRRTYDVLNRPIKLEVGTDAGVPGDMATVSETFYDSGGTATPGVGNGRVTLERRHVDGSTVRDTVVTYDHRGNAVKVENPATPHTFTVYDNLNRPVQSAVFKSVPTGIGTTLADRGRYTETAYSQRGMVYRQRTAIDATQGSPTFLENHSWFDENGRTIASWGPSAPGTKTTYDGLGRVKTTYVTDRGDDAAPGAGGNHADAAALTDDVVLEQTTYRYIADEGLMDLMTRRQRTHTASATGDLASASSASSIITYSGMYYDDANRPIRSVSFGTNDSGGFVHGGAAPTITQGSPPSPSSADATKLVTRTDYNSRGAVDVVTGPDESETKTFYDDLGRRIATVENYDDATVAWNGGSGRWVAGNLSLAQPDVDRVTSYVYDAKGHVVKQVAHLPHGVNSDDPRITEYIYGTVKGANDDESEIASFDLLAETRYPDESTGAAGTTDQFKVRQAYNRQGEVIRRINQEENLHAYARNARGQVTAEVVTFDGSTSMDQWADRIETAYDAFGRREHVRTKDGSTVLNAVSFGYDTLWHVNRIWQAFGGDTVTAGGGQSPQVTYNYSTSSAAAGGNYSRLAVTTYPDGSSVDTTYGSGGSTDDLISRVKALKANSGAITFVEYGHLGLGMAAVTDYAQPDVALDYQVAHDGSRTAGEYPGLDRFGRVVKHAWVDGGLTTHGSDPDVPNVPPVVELAYGYDNAGSRTYMKDGRPGAQRANADWKYTYDGLDRLTEAKRGVYDVGMGTIAVSAGSERWALDMLGNMGTFELDRTGDGDYADDGEKEIRTHNTANEIESQAVIYDVANLGNGDNLPVLLDDALRTGSMTNARQLSPTAGAALVYYTHDAWDRLVKVTVGADVRAEHEYNGLNWRTVKRVDTDANTTLDQRRVMYYDQSWRIVQEDIADGFNVSSVTDRIRQHVWGLRYVDDLVHSRENNNFGNDFFGPSYERRHYHLTDAMFSSVAVVDSAGALLERVAYTPYGRARHSWATDVDGDGAGGQTSDNSAVTAALTKGIHQAGYNVDADVNRDGVVNSTDGTIVSGGAAAALAEGATSAPGGVDSVVGWDGYVFNGEAALYTVRHRTLQPELGRWLQRDPLNYRDGMSLFAYVQAKPSGFRDPSGLICCADECGTRAEGRWIVRNLGMAAAGAAVTCRNASRDAEEMVDAPNRNAIRHCTFSCCLTAILGWDGGAQAILAHHELCGLNCSNSPVNERLDDMFIDLCNNRIGRRYGELNPGILPIGTYCANICYTRLRGAGLCNSPDDYVNIPK